MKEIIKGQRRRDEEKEEVGRKDIEKEGSGEGIKERGL